VKIIVTGAYGQLGGELCRLLGSDAIPLDIDTLDLCDGPAVLETVGRLKPDAVINCAAYTQVDLAETQQQKCQQVNAGAVEHLATACARLDCILVQVSTDYVFGGDVGRILIRAVIARIGIVAVSTRCCNHREGHQYGQHSQPSFRHAHSYFSPRFTGTLRIRFSNPPATR
jgi:nucleoside-diphosphate-sugar epimerase